MPSITQEQLAQAFTAAREAALALADTEDGGTCNLDTPVVFLPHVPKARVEAAAALAGICVHHDTWLGRACWFVYTPLNGQANRRNRMAEAATKALKDAGLNATTYLQMD